MIDKKARTIFREAFLKYIDYVDKTSPNFDNNMARKLSYNIGQLMEAYGINSYVMPSTGRIFKNWIVFRTEPGKYSMGGIYASHELIPPDDALYLVPSMSRRELLQTIRRYNLGIFVDIAKKKKLKKLRQMVAREVLGKCSNELLQKYDTRIT